MMASVALGDATQGTTDGETVEHGVERLFLSEYGPLVRLASLLLGDPGASQEVVQDAFVKLQVHWGRIHDPDKAPAWLRSAVLNGARSRLRQGRVRRRHLERVVVLAPSAEAGALASDEHRRVMVALRGLPLRQREALVLKFYLDLSEAETAAAMDVSLGTVKTHVHRGLESLRESLGLEDDR